MLVLSRKAGQKIFIGDDICITVIEWYPDRVKIGIEAPRRIEILRGELKDRMDNEKKEEGK